ncbi:hypothetical protein C8046_13660 [Serinibacter arcticus]|uniref:Uncharacterized protein n=1 Tax=Serinibacter arcticus TaxID=1655435 RepID=A0A2U1ZX32_9MICO|nr:hypothetical protein [Serinibacter arcticus]PWD51547.1 hypothetical protein C8046_13660 [Serinibacter arcticus]
MKDKAESLATRRRRPWIVAGVVLALLLQMVPAFAFRFATVGVPNANSQTFTQANTPNVVATYSASGGNTVMAPALDTWPWTGAASTTFTPNLTTNPSAKQFEVAPTGCPGRLRSSSATTGAPSPSRSRVR